MENQKSFNAFRAYFAPLAIVVCLIVALLLYIFVMGNEANFDGEHKPKPGNYLGMIYLGGFIVPILMTMMLVVFTFVIERFITLTLAGGKGSTEKFVLTVKTKLSAGDIDGAIAECDVQKGTVANVVKAVLHKYKALKSDYTMDKEQKMTALEKEVEEATALEMPMLNENLPILATIGSVATLVALLGTVIGMIRAFAGMAQAGAPDATALATGISEALINTALGIGTSAVAILFYNYFQTKNDDTTFRIEESAMSITGTFAATEK